MRKRYTGLILFYTILVAAGCARFRPVPKATETPVAVVLDGNDAQCMHVAMLQEKNPVRGPGYGTAETAEPNEPSEYRFPDDAAGKLLSKYLTPDPTRGLPEPSATPHRTPAPKQLESPDLPLPTCLVEHPTLPESGRKGSLPRLVSAEILAGLLEVALPQAQPMVVGDRAKEPGADVNRPASLPILARPLPDRASLADATTDVSAAGAISASMPSRVGVVPFQRQSLPDPFENRRPLRLPVPEEYDAGDGVAATAAVEADRETMNQKMNRS